MVVLLIDANLDGHAELIDRRLASDTWRELREHLDIRFLHFEESGLNRTASREVTRSETRSASTIPKGGTAASSITERSTQTSSNRGGTKLTMRCKRQFR